MRNYFYLGGDFGNLKFTLNDFENTGIIQCYGHTDKFLINLNNFKLNYNSNRNLIQNIVEIMDFTTTKAFNQCVFTGNVIEANQINTKYENKYIL